jgi:hypothetical protein
MAPGSLLAGLGLTAAFAVPVATGAVLVGVAAVVAVREAQHTARPGVVGVCLLGAGGVIAQIVLVRTTPASRLGFLLGATGGWCLYTGWQFSRRWEKLAEQALAVGGVLWISGTLAITVSVTGPDWPIRWGLTIGLTAAIATVTLGRWHRERTGIERTATPVIVAFVGPAAIGAVFGPEILFVLYLIAVVVVVLGWSLLRLEQAR